MRHGLLGGAGLCLAGWALAAAQPAGEPCRENVLRFDPRQVEVRRIDGRWMLLAGDVWLKDFGRQEREAYQARNLVRNLDLTEYRSLGQPQPQFEYFLSHGQPPRGTTPGLQITAFDPAKLTLRQHSGLWCVLEENRPLFHFGLHQDQAEQALAILRRHGFDRIGRLGVSSRPLLTVLLKSESPFDAAPAATRPAQKPVPEPKTPQPEAIPPRQAPAAAAANPFTRLAFDFRQAQVRKVGSSWKIMVGTSTLKDFGPDEYAARQALRLIQSSQVTEQYRLEKGGNRFEYYLTRGQAPRSRALTPAAVGFHPQTLTIRQLDSGWWITDLDRRLFEFDDPEVAQSVLDVIRRYRFDQVSYIGQSKQSMMYFATNR
jgi:hypothetical protein